MSYLPEAKNIVPQSMFRVRVRNFWGWNWEILEVLNIFIQLEVFNLNIEITYSMFG